MNINNILEEQFKLFTLNDLEFKNYLSTLSNKEDINLIKIIKKEIEESDEVVEKKKEIETENNLLNSKIKEIENKFNIDQRKLNNLKKINRNKIFILEKSDLEELDLHKLIKTYKKLKRGSFSENESSFDIYNDGTLDTKFERKIYIKFCVDILLNKFNSSKLIQENLLKNDEINEYQNIIKNLYNKKQQGGGKNKNKKPNAINIDIDSIITNINNRLEERLDEIIKEKEELVNEIQNEINNKRKEFKEFNIDDIIANIDLEDLKIKKLKEGLKNDYNEINNELNKIITNANFYKYLILIYFIKFKNSALELKNSLKLQENNIVLENILKSKYNIQNLIFIGKENIMKLIDKINKIYNKLKSAIDFYNKFKNTDTDANNSNIINNEYYLSINGFLFNCVVINYYNSGRLGYNTLIKKLIDNTVLKINSYINEKQLEIESKFVKSEPYSKKIFKKYNYNINDEIISKLEANINFKEYYDNNKEKLKNKKIYLPELKSYNESKLTKLYGLCNYEIYNLINNNNLSVCYNNIERFTLKNQLVLKLRDDNLFKFSNLDVKSLEELENIDMIISNIDNFYDINSTELNINTIENILNNVNKNAFDFFECITKFYLVSYEDDELYYFRNFILDIDLPITDELINRIKACEQRYFVIQGTMIGFKDTLFDNLKNVIEGGHRVSIFLDLKDKKIFYYDPIDDDYHSAYNLNGEKINNCFTFLIKKYLKDNNSFFDDFIVMPTFYNIAVQSLEYEPAKMSEIIYMNQKKYTTKNIVDWAGGYCGLWNILLSFLITINTHLSLEELLIFYHGLFTSNDVKIIKKLIRTFAYYIEKVINGEMNDLPINEYPFFISQSEKGVSLSNLSNNKTMGSIIGNEEKNLNIHTHIDYFIKSFVKNLIGYGKLGYMKEKKIQFINL
jgi:hypothetical protein